MLDAWLPKQVICQRKTRVSAPSAGSYLSTRKVRLHAPLFETSLIHRFVCYCEFHWWVRWLKRRDTCALATWQLDQVYYSHELHAPCERLNWCQPLGFQTFTCFARFKHWIVLLRVQLESRVGLRSPHPHSSRARTFQLDVSCVMKNTTVFSEALSHQFFVLPPTYKRTTFSASPQ